MRISHFFIDRPIFAGVLSIVFVILGGVAFLRLPIAQYPEIAPPVINITGQFPGASAETVGPGWVMCSAAIRRVTRSNTVPLVNSSTEQCAC